MRPWFAGSLRRGATRIVAVSGAAYLYRRTTANREGISDVNGILVDDTADAYSRGLDPICDVLPRSSLQKVADSVRVFALERVTMDTLAPLIESIDRQDSGVVLREKP